MKKSVGIIGASGLLGSHLAQEYDLAGWEVVRFSRSKKQVSGQDWRQISKGALANLTAVVNLAGERIDQRWTKENKERFWQSRVGVTRELGRMLKELPPKQRPEVWVNTSAVGIYGDAGEQVLNESSAVGGGYLANLCEEWEVAATSAKLDSVRLVTIRIGVVLGVQSAAWKRMASVFKLGAGGKLGSGAQWFPWIHIDDITGAIVHLTEREGACGSYNLVAPEQVRNIEFTKALADEVKRPALLPVPRVALQLVLGDFASALLSSLRVSSEKLTKTGYRWRYPELKLALSDLNSQQ